MDNPSDCAQLPAIIVDRASLYQSMNAIKTEVGEEGFSVPADACLSDIEESVKEEQHTQDILDPSLESSYDADMTQELRDHVPAEFRYYDNETIVSPARCVTYDDSSQKQQSKQDTAERVLVYLINVLDYYGNNGEQRCDYREALSLLRQNGWEGFLQIIQESNTQNQPHSQAINGEALVVKDHVRRVVLNTWGSDEWIRVEADTQATHAHELEQCLCRDWSLIQTVIALIYAQYGHSSAPLEIVPAFANLLNASVEARSITTEAGVSNENPHITWLDMLSPVHLFFYTARALPSVQYEIDRNTCEGVRSAVHTILNTPRAGQELSVYNTILCGAYRRGATSCTTIDLVVGRASPRPLNTTPDAHAKHVFSTVVDILIAHSTKSKTLLLMEPPMRASLHRFLCIVGLGTAGSSPMRYILDLKAVTAEQEACSLLFYTGPAEHNYDIAKEAQEQGICLFPRESEVLPQCQFGTDMGIEGCTDGVISEAGIYELLNVDYVRPEDRF